MITTRAPDGANKLKDFLSLSLSKISLKIYLTKACRNQYQQNCTSLKNDKISYNAFHIAHLYQCMPLILLVTASGHCNVLYCNGRLLNNHQNVWSIRVNILPGKRAFCWGPFYPFDNVVMAVLVNQMGTVDHPDLSQLQCPLIGGIFPCF